MGSLYSYYDRSTNQLIFHPPNTSPAAFEQLKAMTDVCTYVTDLEVPDERLRSPLAQSASSRLKVPDENSRLEVPDERLRPPLAQSASSRLEVPCFIFHPIQNMDKTKCIVFAHGNGCDIYTMYDFIRRLSRELDIDVLIFDYPGYGLARGQAPTEQGCYDSIKQVVDYAKTKYADITLIGHSLGTGVVMDYAAKFDWKSPLILISPYKSMSRVLSDNSSCSVVKSIDKFGTWYKLEKIVGPIKIFHGDADTLINISHAKDLFESLRHQGIEPTWLEGIGHNDILDTIIANHMPEIIRVMNFKDEQ